MAERVVAAEQGRDYVIPGDAEGYWDLATDLASGRKYAVYSPPRRVLRTPGLPMAIAASIELFGENRTAARGFLAILAAIGPVMIYGLGWRVGGRTIGLVAGLLAAVSPLAVGLSPLLLSDGLFSMLLALQLSIAGPLLGCGPLEHENKPSWLRVIVLGISAAMAVLVRPAWLPAVPIIAGALVVFAPPSTESTSQWRTAWGRAIVFTATFCVAMSPWVVRNANVTGHFVPTSLWLGPTLYDSFGPDADGGSNMAFFDAEADQRAGLSEYEVDRWYRERAIEAVRSSPARAGRLAVAKQLRFWSIWPRADEIASTSVRIAIATWSLIVALLAVYGLATTKWTWPQVVLVMGPLVYFAMLHLVFVGSMRYRMPAELPLCVAAATGLQSLYSRKQSKR